MFKAKESADEHKNRLFTNKMILYFIIPIAIEKLLLRLLDIADNIMVSHLGEDILDSVVTKRREQEQYNEYG